MVAVQEVMVAVR